jgi:hypothetical protein
VLQLCAGIAEEFFRQVCVHANDARKMESYSSQLQGADACIDAIRAAHNLCPVWSRLNRDPKVYCQLKVGHEESCDFGDNG